MGIVLLTKAKSCLPITLLGSVENAPSTYTFSSLLLANPVSETDLVGKRKIKPDATSSSSRVVEAASSPEEGEERL
ncbi:BQ5605_C015g07844 [Microbotryum silenes-dioicae]|uniref:BQ5605_C015g07844 protein n=1 Tax=Microbotryum silenes-dioicae TaxID=796604 RepID=A0A2X0MMP6_9BASI|nr:BQ5605_C015g07844 [Microbotryum silenes-dioicae]